jgi:N-acetylglucosaminyldiphosphoundecaprenol N-acetyl-beta-D-mannosaminyltransferase
MINNNIKNNRTHILGMRLDAISLKMALDNIMQWANNNESAYVCVSNVHMCMEAYEDSIYQSIINDADLVVPDGKPLVVAASLLEKYRFEHIRGADLTRAVLNMANKNKIKLGLFGSTEENLFKMSKNINKKYHKLEVVASISPPFRELTRLEEEQYIKAINESGAQILLVGLGCPKQEKWMALHKGKISSVMIGVGAVFDFFSGNKKEAPIWTQKIGLEWLFRLISEPKRLWRRYIYYNPKFILNFVKQYMNTRLGKL